MLRMNDFCPAYEDSLPGAVLDVAGFDNYSTLGLWFETTKSRLYAFEMRCGIAAN